MHPPKNEFPISRRQAARRLSLVWLVPVVAAVVASWLVWQNLKQLGPVVTVTFRDGTGLSANQTIVKYRGVRVGKVQSIQLSRDTRQVEVKLRLDRRIAKLAVAGSTFWVVRPEVGVGGLHGLETIVTGPYIQIQPGDSSGLSQKAFTGLEEAPMLESKAGEAEFIVMTPNVSSLAHGSPVYYRGLEVGSVNYLALGQDSTAVAIHLLINPKFVHLIRTNSVFWNAGGIDMSLHFLKIEVSAENFKSLIIGGIAFATPDDYGREAAAGTIFPLHEKPDNKWLAWVPVIAVSNATVALPANPSLPHLQIEQ